jgi:hypothetical protein
MSTPLQCTCEEPFPSCYPVIDGYTTCDNCGGLLDARTAMNAGAQRLAEAFNRAHALQQSATVIRGPDLRREPPLAPSPALRAALARVRVYVATNPSPGREAYDGFVDVWVAIAERLDVETLLDAAALKLKRTLFPGRGRDAWRFVRAELLP